MDCYKLPIVNSRVTTKKVTEKNVVREMAKELKRHKMYRKQK